MFENWAGGGGFEQLDYDVVFYISEDVYVWGDQYFDMNFGVEDYFVIKNNGEGYRNDWCIFFKFDLSSLIVFIYDVRLWFNVVNDVLGLILDVLYYVFDDSWIEGMIIYNN